MKRLIIKCGLMAAVVIILLFLFNYNFLDPRDFALQEMMGWLAIFLSLLFIFFGLKSYRENEGQGYLSFGRGLGLGMLITLIPALIFGIFDGLYVTVIDPDFYTAYGDYYVESLKSQYSGAELKAKLAEAEMWSGENTPGFGLTFVLMFLNTAVVGFIISLISTFILRRSAPKPA